MSVIGKGVIATLVLAGALCAAAADAQVPPGHARRLEGHGKGPHGCPPGLAKQGRC